MTRTVLFRTAKQKQGDRKRAQKLRGRSKPKSYLRTAAEGAAIGVTSDSLLSGALAYRSVRKSGMSRKNAIATAKNIAKSRLKPHNSIKTGAVGAAYRVASRMGEEETIRRARDRRYRKFSNKTQNIVTFKKNRTARQKAGDLARALKLRGRKKSKGISTKKLIIAAGGGLALGAGVAHVDSSPVAKELIRVGLSAQDKHYQSSQGGPVMVRTEYDDRYGLVQRGKSAYATARDVKKSRLESAKTAWKAMGRQLKRGKRNNPSKKRTSREN